MLVTFALTCYNQQDFVRDAVRAALAQDYEPLEILIADNCSTDSTYELIKGAIKEYPGPHSVRVIRQSKNIRGEIFPLVTEMARGEFVIIGHGDDISYPGRTRCLIEAWKATNASLLSSNAEIIDSNSRLLNILNPDSEPKWVPASELARSGYTSLMHGATLAWHPDIFRCFAPLDNLRIHAAQDHVLPFRAALLNGGYYVAQPLLRVRTHGKNWGHERADETRGALVASETAGAYNLGARICMLEDLDFLESTKKTSVPPEIRNLLIAEILSLVKDWSSKRNQLFTAGAVPTWIGKAEMEGRVDYGKGYFDELDMGLRSVPAKIIKLLIKKLRELARMTLMRLQN